MALIDDLTAYYSHDTALGLDSHGSYGLTVAGSPSSVTGKHGNAVRFTSTSDAFTSSNAIYDPGATFTIVFWLRFNGSLPGSDVRIVSNLPFGTSGFGWEIRYTSSTQTLAAQGGTGNSNTVPIVADQWYFVAYEGGQGQSLFRVNTTSVTYSENNVPPGATPPALRVGPSGTADFSVDEMAYFLAKKPSTDLDALYNSGNGLSYADISGGGGSVDHTGIIMRHIMGGF